jgi:hypothetical protein
LDNFFNDLIAREIAGPSIQWAEEPGERDESGEDSDSEDGEKHEVEIVVTTLRMPRPYRIGLLSLAIVKCESRIPQADEFDR